MPKGHYDRSQMAKVKKEVGKLAAKTKRAKAVKQMHVVIFSVVKGKLYLHREELSVRSYFKLFQIVLEDYVAQGIEIKELRVS